jgi:hypothetical protein
MPAISAIQDEFETSLGNIGDTLSQKQDTQKGWRYVLHKHKALGSIFSRLKQGVN